MPNLRKMRNTGREKFEFQSDKLLDYNTATPPRNSIHSLPFWVGICILFVLFGLFVVVYFIDEKLPTPLTVSDEIRYPDSFITERAAHDLELLTGLGSRITGGYENEELAVDFLKREINFIMQQANRNQKLEMDVQVVSGAYNLDLLLVDQINVYANVQNVVVKLYSKHNDSEHSLLVNSHFDSVPTSAGGSDDGINVVAMLEILRKLSRSSERPEHNIIFLFNGAEETTLQASHGFITQHKWAKTCKVVLNLEACGAGGKIILFQSGPETPWLLKYYNKVPHPHGQAAGEEIFQTGIIPSDTDFRIFRDFGGLVGFDMAFFKDGYRYHTKFDNFSNIPLGSYQHVGDNALSLVRNLANAPELVDATPSSGKVVYYDILGLFIMSYTTLWAAVINSVTVIISVAVFVVALIDFKLGVTRKSYKYLLTTFGAIVFSWIIAALFVFIIALILDVSGKSLSWYANPWLLFGLYVTPTIGLSGSLLIFVKNEKLSLNVMCQIQAHLIRLIWTVLLLIGTILNIRAVYAIMVPVLFNSLAFAIIHLGKLQHSVRKWQIVYMISLVVPTIIIMYQAHIVVSLFIPITGRMGSDKNPDVIIGLLVTFFTIFITSPIVGLTNILNKSKYYFIFLGLVFATFFIIVFTPLGFAYSGNPEAPKPQRQWLLHTKRVFHDEMGVVEKMDSGIFMLNLDRNSPSILKSYVKDLEKAKNMDEDCDKYLLCGLPLSHAKMVQIMRYSTWIPSSEPVLPVHVKFSVKSKEQLTPFLVRYNVTTSGPDRMGFYILPKVNMTIVNISLVENMKQPDALYNGRPLYFILYAYGKEKEDLSFSFDVQVPENWNETTVDIAVTARYVHENEFIKTPYYTSFLKQFPDWTDITPWVASYSSFII